MSSHRFISRSLVTGLVAASFAASASAMGPSQEPIRISQQERQVVASRGQGTPTPIRGPVTHVEPTAQPAGGSDFEWGDAGIGAGVAGGLMLVAFGSAGLVHRRRIGVAH
jgi:hypothetical protein